MFGKGGSNFPLNLSLSYASTFRVGLLGLPIAPQSSKNEPQPPEPPKGHDRSAVLVLGRIVDVSLGKDSQEKLDC